jgi:crossover junction endodeoxyribonuclease RuvC
LRIARHPGAIFGRAAEAATTVYRSVAAAAHCAATHPQSAVRNPTMRILGIDPGLNRTGFGVIDAHGDRLACVDAGVIRVPAGELAVRLGVILRELTAVIDTYRPGLAVVEQVFVNVNPKATLLLGQARGAALCAAVSGGLPVHEYSALAVKQAVVGTGRATKEQVQMMIARLLSLAAAPQADAADALACAVCHAHASRLRSALAPALTVGVGARRGGGRGAARSAWAARAAALGK